MSSNIDELMFGNVSSAPSAFTTPFSSTSTSFCPFYELSLVAEEPLPFNAYRPGAAALLQPRVDIWQVDRAMADGWSRDMLTMAYATEVVNDEDMASEPLYPTMRYLQQEYPLSSEEDVRAVNAALADEMAGYPQMAAGHQQAQLPQQAQVTTTWPAPPTSDSTASASTTPDTITGLTTGLAAPAPTPTTGTSSGVKKSRAQTSKTAAEKRERQQNAAEARAKFGGNRKVAGSAKRKGMQKGLKADSYKQLCRCMKQYPCSCGLRSS